jgi:hypothetical protein
MIWGYPATFEIWISLERGTQNHCSRQPANRASKQFRSSPFGALCGHFGRPNATKCLFGSVRVGVWNFVFFCYSLKSEKSGPKGAQRDHKDARRQFRDSLKHSKLWGSRKRLLQKHNK